MKAAIFLFLLSATTLVSAQKGFSPYDFGLAEARTDVERFEALYNTHAAAIEAGINVDYSRIDTLHIEIPANAKRIPLTRNNDFKGAVFHVKNNAKTFYLFDLQQRDDSLVIDKSLLDGTDFSTIPQLAKGLHLLIIEDQTPWVGKRAGYNYGATRRDLLLIHNGRSENLPVASYNNPQSQPAFTYCAVKETPISIKNLTIHRDAESTFKTYCFNIARQHNVQIENIAIYTPENDFYGDAAFNISHCSHLSMNNVTINGTYSQTDHYGYGIQLNNIWNCCFERLQATANWGIFGTNNINNALLLDCNINRFDIHCYGRDVLVQNCTFSKLYNQFSSVYGQVSFLNCTFSEFIPVLFEPSYNAYTQFDLRFQNCIFNATASRYYLIQAGKLDNVINERPELTQKCLPNISIQNLTVNVPANVPKIVLFQPKGEVSEQLSVGHINQIRINGLRFNNEKENQTANFHLSNARIRAARPLQIEISDLNLFPDNSDLRDLKNKNGDPATLTLNISHNPRTDLVRIRNSNLIFNLANHSELNIIFEQCALGLLQCPSSTNAQRIYRRCNIYSEGNKKKFCIDEKGSFEYCKFIFGKMQKGSSIFSNELKKGSQEENSEKKSPFLKNQN